MSLKLNSSGGGSVTLQEPTTASNRTINLPDVNGTVVAADASGNVGIGTSSPSAKLNVAAANPTNGTLALIQNTSTSAQTGALLWLDVGNVGSSAVGIPGGSSNALAFYVGGVTSASERARIDSSGNLLVGKTSYSDSSGVGLGFSPAAQQLSQVVNTTTNTFVLYNSAASAYRFFVSQAGQINATSTSITAISDQSLKENIRDLDTGLTQVMALRPRRFDWKEETQIGETNVAGFIAQEVEQVLPELVYDYQYTEGVTKKSLKMGDILPTLVKAIQEQQAMIEELKARVASLEGV